MKKIVLLMALVLTSVLSTLTANSYARSAGSQAICSREDAGEFYLSFQARGGALVKVFGTVDGFWGHGSAMIHIILPDGTVIDDFILFSGHTPDEKLAQLFQQFEGLEDAFWEAVDAAATGG